MQEKESIQAGTSCIEIRLRAQHSAFLSDHRALGIRAAADLTFETQLHSDLSLSRGCSVRTFHLTRFTERKHRAIPNLSGDATVSDSSCQREHIWMCQVCTIRKWLCGMYFFFFLAHKYFLIPQIKNCHPQRTIEPGRDASAALPSLARKLQGQLTASENSVFIRWQSLPFRGTAPRAGDCSRQAL